MTASPHDRRRTPAAAATAALWSQRDVAADDLETAAALLGLTLHDVAVLAAEDLLAWPETVDLVAAAPELLDRLAALTFSGAAAPSGETETPEHHLLCWCLRQIVAAGESLDRYSSTQFDDRSRRARRETAATATDLIQHEAIGATPLVEDHVRAERRVANGSLRAPYATALAFCEAHRHGLRVEALASLVDRRTALQHHVLVAMLRVLWPVGVRGKVSVVDGAVHVGPVSYRHPSCRGASGRQGIRVGTLLIDVPDWPGQSTVEGWSRLRERAAIRDPLLIADPDAVSGHEAQILDALRRDGAVLTTS